MKIAVHDFGFHADDVCAVAILKIIHPDLEFIRTRKPEELKKVEMRVDVGGKYNPETSDFDHHQAEFKEKRKNGMPYASAGLIWKHFGMKVVSSEEVFDYIDKRLIEYIDANDVGLKTFKETKGSVYAIENLIDVFNPPWPKITKELYDKGFGEAVTLFSDLLKKEIEMAEGIVESKKIIRKAIKNSNGEYLVLKDKIPWKEVVVEESKIKFVVSYNSLENNWAVVAVPKSLNDFELRKKLPKEWAGLFGKNLEKVTGVKDVVFCHRNLFLAITKSRESALALVKIALDSKS